MEDSQENFKPFIAHIVCIDKDFNIGVHSKDTNEHIMPWGRAVKTDLKRFKELTENNIIIMGTNTYHSIGKILPNRINIIVSASTYKYTDSNTYYVRYTLEEALDLADALAHQNQCNIFIIGGSSIYRQTEHIIDRAYITLIDTSYTHRPFKFSNYEFIKYDSDYIEDFKLVSKEAVKEQYFVPEILFTVWERVDKTSQE